MRVLQAMAGAEFGGAESFFVRLALALRAAGLDQRVVIRRHRKRAETLRGGGIDVTELPFGGPLDLRSRWMFRRQTAAFGPRVVMTWMNRATRFCPRGRRHGFVHVARLGGYYDLKYYRHCDHLIGNTPDLVDYLTRQGWPAERAHFLPNFVSADRRPPLPRRHLSTPDSVPLVLALGRLHRNKAFDVLLDALVRVPDAYLWLAGDGPLRRDLEIRAGHLGIKPRVRFLGWRDDTAELFAACDLFVCPSRHEPLGNVVLEAWAQEVPVVATDSLGPGTLIEHNQSGLLVPVDDSRRLAEAMRYLLDDPAVAARNAAGGHERYRREFTEQVVVGRYLDFFQSIAGTCAASPA